MATNLSSIAVVSVALQTVLITPGLFLYVIVFVGLIKTYKSSKNQFYILMISLGVGDIVYLSETLFYSVPCIICQKSIFGNIGERVIGHVDTVTWFLQCSHVLFISINRLRFVVGASLQTFDKVYTVLKIFIWVFIIWIFSIGMSAMSEAAFCQKYFDFKSFHWIFNCSTDEDLMTNPGMIVNNVVSGVFCITSGILYTITWIVVKVKKVKRNSITVNNCQRRQNFELTRISLEWSILIQFTAVTACLLANYLGFWIIPEILSETSAILLIQVFALANATVNPYVYLIFNTNLREQILTFFPFMRKSSRTSSITGRMITVSHENSARTSSV